MVCNVNIKKSMKDSSEFNILTQLGYYLWYSPFLTKIRCTLNHHLLQIFNTQCTHFSPKNMPKTPMYTFSVYTKKFFVYAMCTWWFTIIICGVFLTRFCIKKEAFEFLRKPRKALFYLYKDVPSTKFELRLRLVLIKVRERLSH